MNESEKEQEMSTIRRSYEKMKQGEDYASLPDEAKEQIEKAVTAFEFTIQTEYEECKEFMLEVLNSEEITDFEALANDEDLGPMVQQVSEAVASVFRSMVSTLLQDVIRLADHLEREHDMPADPYLEMMSKFSQMMMVVDTVFTDMINAEMGVDDLKFGIAQRGNGGLHGLFEGPL